MIVELRIPVHSRRGVSTKQSLYAAINNACFPPLELMSSFIPTLQSLRQQIASLLLYQSVLENEVGQGFTQLLIALESQSSLSCLQAYGAWFKALATTGQSWEDFIVTQILQDDNPFTQQAQRYPDISLPTPLIAAAKQDLQALQQISRCSSQKLSEWVNSVSGMSAPPIAWQGEKTTIQVLQQAENWAETWETLAQHYRIHGTGLFAKSKALRWYQGCLQGIPHPDPISLKEIVGYESQQDALIQNTEFLLAGYQALHILLYGSRGSGKSSCVKALLQKYGDRGLRLIEVTKSELHNLPEIVEYLRPVPQKFIIFVDDLSFEEDDAGFKALKVVLEGSVTPRAKNVVVYATSNRRHLIREFFEDRPRPSDADEIHHWDTVQEKLSFSDRFGLTLTFEPANQETYLKIVRHLATIAKINVSQDELDYRAKQWATRHNGRSGRTARQFIDFLQAESGVRDSH